MQAPILTVSPSLMQWMILKIDLYKAVCYTDIYHYFHIYMHAYSKHNDYSCITLCVQSVAECLDM